MSDTISENDLRRAIGLALEEFDSQLVEAFRDSNRKCMVMFAKAEEVSDIQSKIDKKVNVTEYHGVLQKLSELRRYIDTMAESVLVGHQESKEEFAKEVNVEKALKLKADLQELTQVRAKLERLEAIVTDNDLKHNSLMAELKAQVYENNATNIDANRSMIETNAATIEKLKKGQIVIDKRVSTAEDHITQLTEDTKLVSEKQYDMQERQDGTIWRACQSLQGLFHGMEVKMSSFDEELQLMRSNEEQFKNFSTQKIQQLFDADEQVKEQVKFLIEASEMLKRRTREFKKSYDAQVKDLASSESKLTEQVAAIERSFKGQERELRALEKRVPHALTLLAAEFLPPAEPASLDPNQHLSGVLAQLEKIASGPVQKFPRPMGNDLRMIADQDSTLMPALRTQGAYGLSPRVPLPSGLRPAPPSGVASGGPRKAPKEIRS
jgi:hypothetical protein